MAIRTLSELDRVDRKILAILQADGRMANADLAKQINLSPTPTLERVRRLERDGFIEGYVAVLNPEKMEASLVAFVEVSLDRTTEDVFTKFADAAKQAEQIIECNMVAGGYDYLLKVRTRDIGEYRRFLSSALAALPGIRETHTYMVMEEVKGSAKFAVPLSAEVGADSTKRRKRL